MRRSDHRATRARALCGNRTRSSGLPGEVTAAYTTGRGRFECVRKGQPVKVTAGEPMATEALLSALPTELQGIASRAGIEPATEVTVAFTTGQVEFFHQTKQLNHIRRGTSEKRRTRRLCLAGPFETGLRPRSAK